MNCWIDDEDLSGGSYWRMQISEAIQKYERVIVVCSEGALLRPNVVEEILEAIEQERKNGTMKLFPITIDHFLFGEDMEDSIASLLPPRQRRENWLDYIRSYHILDFSGWNDKKPYNTATKRLLRDLNKAI